MRDRRPMPAARLPVAPVEVAPSATRGSASASRPSRSRASATRGSRRRPRRTPRRPRLGGAGSSGERASRAVGHSSEVGSSTIDCDAVHRVLDPRLLLGLEERVVLERVVGHVPLERHLVLERRVPAPQLEVLLDHRCKQRRGVDGHCLPPGRSPCSRRKSNASTAVVYNRDRARRESRRCRRLDSTAARRRQRARGRPRSLWSLWRRLPPSSAGVSCSRSRAGTGPWLVAARARGAPTDAQRSASR